jgi:hypothetical protein
VTVDGRPVDAVVTTMVTATTRAEYEIIAALGFDGEALGSLTRHPTADNWCIFNDLERSSPLSPLLRSSRSTADDRVAPVLLNC